MASVLPTIFRQYTNDESFSRSLTIIPLLSEFQLSLAFARDHSDGQFVAGWNARLSEIRDFKRKLQEFGVVVRVFISIGGRGRSFPFNPSDPNEWITNATNSLQRIIADWQVDGIDIFYEHIDTDAQVFSQTVGSVITNLMENKVITVASISPSEAVTPQYLALVNDFPGLFDYVDYQLQNEENGVGIPDNNLAALFQQRVAGFPGVALVRLLVGYSLENEDWGTVSPSEFTQILISFLNMGEAAGFSLIYY